MNPNQPTLILTWSLLLFAAGMAGGDGVREIEIKPDPPDADKQIFTIRFVPDETTVYDQIVIACTLQQELVLATPDGGQTNMICQAGIFTARQRNVKMVKGVDCYVSFFVQLRTQRFCDMSGKSNVQTNVPVTVARMKITAYRKGKAVWSVPTNARGIYRPGADRRPPATRTNAMWKAKDWTPPPRCPMGVMLKRRQDWNYHVDS